MAKLPQTFRLEPHARKKVEKQRAAEKDARLHKRLSALLWLDEGRTRDEVARLVGSHVRTIKNWLKLYLKGGLTALCTLSYKGDVGNLSVAQGQQLKAEVATGRFKCAAEAAAWVEATFSVTFTPAGMRKLLNRLGCTFHKSSGFLFKANREKQKEFVQDYEADKGKAKQQPMRRYFIDGVHPLYGLEVLFYCWLVRGQRYEVGVGGGRKRLNILGAYCPDDQEYLDQRYVKENLNGQSVIALFKLLMERHPTTKHFRIYLDNARYQHAIVLREWIAQTQKECGVFFDLKYLPPYSPNLNLIERLWKFLRKEALQKWHPTFEDMQQAVGDVLDHLERYQAQIKKLMTERFRLTPEQSTIVVGVGNSAK
jgi:transposase